MSVPSTRSPSSIQLHITPKSSFASQANKDLREPLLSWCSASQTNRDTPHSKPDICNMVEHSVYLSEIQSVKSLTLKLEPNSAFKKTEDVSVVKKPNRLRAFFTAIAIAFVALYHWIFSRSSDSQVKAIHNPQEDIEGFFNSSTLELSTPSPAKGYMIEFIASSSADLDFPVNFQEHISSFLDEGC